MQNKLKGRRRALAALVAAAVLAMIVAPRMMAQDRDDDDPPGRAARLGHMDGSVSFQPAGESEWVEAVPNRPMTTGDKLWADRDSRAELELGSTSIRLNSNTGISILNLDDRTVQIQLSSGTISVGVRRLSHDDVFEIDTPNQAFSVLQPGQYRVEASEDGANTVVTVRDGEGESTGNGQTYTVHQGQRATFSGTDRLNADVQQVGDPDGFDRWSYDRDRRFEDSPSARYVSHDVVGYEDLDAYGDWQPSPQYGHVWYPRVAVGWAPYHSGHWAWIDPWGWTWVDEAPWGYAPFHYGRWCSVRGRWGWVPGPVEVRPVYAPALVVFVGGGGRTFGGNVAWFPLGPREVYVPSYHVSRGYVNRVNISNTTVNQVTVTNVYNTTIVNKTTVINNTTYANRNVSGAVMAVPQRGFAGGQPVSRIAVPVDRRELRGASVTARVAVAPSQNAVLGVRSNRAAPIAAPPHAVFGRTVIAKTAPPPPPVSFAARQHMLDEHPGQPVARQEMQRLRPVNYTPSQPLVRQAPPGRPATPVMAPNMSPNMGRPGNQMGGSQPNQPVDQPGNQPGNRASEPNRTLEPPARNNRPMMGQPNNAQPNNRPEMTPPSTNRPSEPNRTFEPPLRNDRPAMGQPSVHPDSTSPTPSEPNRSVEPPARNDRPAMGQPSNVQPSTHPDSTPSTPNRPSEPNRTFEPPARNDRQSVAQPNNRPEANAPAQTSQPQQNMRPAASPRHEEPPSRTQNPPQVERPQQHNAPPVEVRSAPPQQHMQTQPPPKQQTKEDKKR
jgi:hypothetical protein